MEAKRELLLESSREKKALEKLRHKMKERFTQSEKRNEQACLDDTAGNLHGRKGNGKLHWTKEL